MFWVVVRQWSGVFLLMSYYWGLAVKCGALYPAALTRAKDYLITPAICSPLHSRRTVKRASPLSYDLSITTGSRVWAEHDLLILYQGKDVGVAVLKACPVSPPIRCCSHNRPPLGSSALGMSKSYIGIKHRARLTNRFPSRGCQNKQPYNLTRAPNNRGQRNWAYSKKEVQDASIKLRRV